tara:strand:+ start:535 stop:756 length:222 start_codon:yes stop_codon:yes gene_type:complete
MQDKTLGILNYPSIVNKGLISLVNEKLTEGWRPQGGVRKTTDNEGNPLFLQALVLKTCDCEPLPHPGPEIDRQ